MEPSYQKYMNRIQEMTPSEKHSYLRIEYREPTQEWPDYLDYVEEWRDLYQRKLSQIRRDFIFHVLAKHSQRLPCGDHFHRFTTEVPTHSESVSIKNRDCFIDESSCWYQNISRSEDDLISQPHTLNAASLSNIQTQQFKRIVGIRMVTGHEFSTHDLLTFEQYKEQWHDSQDKTTAYEILSRSGVTPLQPKLPDILPGPTTVVEEPVIKTWFTRGPTDIIISNDDVLSDHGFHNLMRVRDDRITVLKKINRIRRPYTDKITPVDVHGAIAQCSACKFSSPWATTSYPGIFYSPPGNGKSTSMKTDCFIGVDTDWLLKHSDFSTMCLPFVKLGIPILTNQYSLIIDTDQKMFGSFSPNHLRTYRGKPYTSIHEIHGAMLSSDGDLVVMYNAGYLNDNLLKLLLMQYVHDVTKQHVYGMNRVKIKHTKTHYHSTNDVRF